MLKQGQKIPLNINVKNHRGEQTNLNDYLGQPLVIYFYPQDDTPGCTIEAKGFENHRIAFNELGVKVIGVSKDSPKRHRSFREKYDLNFELISDEGHQLHKAFGVWQERRMFGSSFKGAVRSTFAVNKKGEIIKVWPRVKPKNHAEEVYQFFKKHLDE